MAASSGPNITKDNLLMAIDPVGARMHSSHNTTDVLRKTFSRWAIGTGSSSGYGQNGDGNSRILDFNPWGAQDIVWDVSNQDATSNADGGWNSSSFTVDPTKMYRYSVWIRRKVLGNGTTYLGCQGNVLNRSNGASNTNPYFRAASWSYGVNNWMLWVGHVWPQGSGTGAAHVDSYVYDVNGNKITAVGDFVSNGAVTGVHRTYLYYSTDVSTNQQFYQPRVDVCDGTEPSIQELVNDYENLDRTGNYNISLNSTVPTATGLTFNGSNSYINFTNPVQPSLPYTVILWAKPNVLLGSGTSSSVRRTPLVGPGPQWNPGIWVTRDFIRVHANTEYRDNAISWNDTNYRMIGQIFDGTTVQTIFNDQILLGTRTAYAPPQPTSLNLGAEISTGNGFNWNGELSGLTYYNRALTANEVKNNFNAHRGRYGI